MSILDSFEFLRPPESKGEITPSERLRIRIFEAACSPHRDHPWAQQINEEDNQQLADKKLVFVQEPANEGPAPKEVVETAVKDMQSSQVSPVDTLYVNEGPLSEAQAREQRIAKAQAYYQEVMAKGESHG